jgi:hypothetical protein
MTVALFLLLPSLLAAPPVADARADSPRRVAVIMLGPDARQAGDLQHKLEERLATLPGIFVVPLADPTVAEPEPSEASWARAAGVRSDPA